VTHDALVGVSALVWKDDREIYFGAFGMADREAKRPMARDTIVQIYSMTKPVTGVALMTLYEEGRFGLDDPISKYLPELAHLKVYAGGKDSGASTLETPRRPVTIRDLTRHTAGLVGGDGEDPVHVAYRKADPMNPQNTLSEMVRRLGEVPLLYHPGERWLYGPAVDVQALLVERLSGRPFAQYLEERILAPLHMLDTRYFVPERDRGRMAVPYDWHDDGTFTRVPDDRAFAANTKPQHLTPGGFGLTSTLDDYMRFAQMLVNGGSLDGAGILRPETIQLMATDAMPPTVTDRSWLPSKGQVGFGIDFAVRIKSPAGPDEAAGEIGEFFWDGAANTLFWVDPRNRLTAVLFTQYFPFGKVPLHKVFRDAVYAAL
jgi:CubicO group peptidase (beta-lactamase class C family)